MPLDELTISVIEEDGKVSVETLKDALEGAMEMLRSMEKEFTTTETVVRWEITRVEMRSPLKLTFAPRVRSIQGKVARKAKTIGRNIVKSFLKGIDAMETGQTESKGVPQHFNEETLRAAQRLTTIAKKEGAKVTLGSNKGNQITLTDNTIRNANEMVSKSRRYTDASTIEGILEVVSVRERRSVFIWDALTNQKIECFVDEEKLKECLSLFGKRVAISGDVTYRNDLPCTIDVESIERLPGEDEVVRLEDIGPINITEGLSSEEHVRRMRDG